MSMGTELTIPRSELLTMLRTMKLIRRFEERSAEHYARGNIGGFLHLYIGEEAVAVGVISPLRDDDKVVTHYRDHGHALARGLDTAACMAELFGKSTGLNGGKGGSMHFFDVEKGFMGGHAIVGAQLPFAVGLAFANRYRGQDSLVVCFLGDGAVNEGEFHESMNLASLWNLPVLFLLENNGFGMGTRVERASAQPIIHRLADRHNIRSHRVDNGQDVFAVREAAMDAIEHIREGNGPYFLEVMTYRFRGHSMADPVEYRQQHEVEPWLELDPIGLLARHLLENDLATPDEIDAIDADVEDEVNEAIRFALESPFPTPDMLYTDVYA